jgi:penicillin-binding protein 2
MANGEQLNNKAGITLMQLLVLGLFFLIALRLWYFQIYNGQEYARKATDNLIQQQSIYAPRGLIRDRDGTILAENKPAYGLAIIREDSRDIEAALRQASRWTEVPLQEVREKFKAGKKRVKPFKRQLLIRNLDYQTLAEIETHLMEWPEFRIITLPLRHYPHGRVVSHILGYVAQADEKELQNNPELQLGDTIGKQGLELSFQEALRGDKGLKQLEVNAQGRELKNSIIEEPVPGKDLTLTIDLDLQQHAWEQLGNHTGVVVVLEPFSGDIQALVSKPAYNNNLFVQGIDQETWHGLLSDPDHPLQNRAIQSSYPPGSVFKLVVAPCALNNEAVTPEKEFFCPGHYKLGRRAFRCWRKGGHGWMDMREAIKQSCDVYFYKVGEKLGVDAISAYARKYGFNAKTGINLPNENPGLIPSKEWKLRRFGRRWQGGETLNLSIGQGYTLVTPLQVARHLGALVNGGYLLKPNLIEDAEPTVQQELPLKQSERDMVIQSMLAAVEEPHGTCWRLRTKNATVGGKTGTAQVVKLKEEDREKETEEIRYKFRDHAWMASFAQQGKQTYVVVVLIEHGGHGSSAAGPVAKAVFDHLFSKE